MTNTVKVKEGDTEYELRPVGNKSKNWFYRHTIGAAKSAGPGKSVLFSVVFILFILYAIILIVPFAWILINSFKDATDFADNKWALNFSAGFDNYVKAFNYKVKGTTVLGMYLNSLLVVGGGVVVTLISCTLASYTMAKYKFKGRGIIYNIVIISMMVPIVGTLPAQYRLMQNLGLVDNIIGVWFLYSGGFGFNFLFLYAYFKSISWTYAEAAQIDGASDFRIFIQIMVPMARPALTAVGVLTFMGLWCDYQTPYFYLNSMPTIALGLKDMSEQLSTTPYNTTLVLATAILATIPILVLFCVFQKTIMNNMTVGGLKG
ncbi:MAG: carbohydrate ABC transporter permease [Clostridia bacterium]|nr:carbohydrate ABC transporter permease [Clostridia bacterium]